MTGTHLDDSRRERILVPRLSVEVLSLPLEIRIALQPEIA